MRTRTHPLLAGHNAWTWKFLPGIVIGFVAHWWLSKNRDDKGHNSGSASHEDQHHQPLEPVLPPEEELKMVMCVNTELGMRAGKIAAQCAHAAVGVVKLIRKHNHSLLKQWEEYGSAKIAVKCPNQAQLLQLQEAAKAQGIPCYLVTDAGRTQIAAGSQTVLAMGPWGKSKLDKLTGHMKLV